MESRERDPLDSGDSVSGVLAFHLLLVMKDPPPPPPHPFLYCTRKALSKLEQINFLLGLFGLEDKKPLLVSLVSPTPLSH